MRKRTDHRRLLPLEPPWRLAHVDEKPDQQRIDLLVEHAQVAAWPCPNCRSNLPLYDHSERREWRNVDAGELTTYVCALAPRVKCPEHGVAQVQLPWAEPRFTYTKQFEHWAIDLLKENGTLRVSEVLGISWDQVYRIMRRAVERGLHARLERPITHFAISASITTGGGELFSVVDAKQKVVRYVAHDLKTLASYFTNVYKEQSEPIEVISMDLDERLIQSLRYRPSARDKIAIDPDHIMRRMDHAVSRVDSGLLKNGGDRELSTRARESRENLRQWLYENSRAARQLQQHWHLQATHSHLDPIADLARLIKRNVQFVLNRWRLDFVGALQLDQQIGDLRRSARGFRNARHLETAIYFHFGDLRLHHASLPDKSPPGNH